MINDAFDIEKVIKEAKSVGLFRRTKKVEELFRQVVATGSIVDVAKFLKQVDVPHCLTIMYEQNSIEANSQNLQEFYDAEALLKSTKYDDVPGLYFCSRFSDMDAFLEYLQFGYVGGREEDVLNAYKSGRIDVDGVIAFSKYAETSIEFSNNISLINNKIAPKLSVEDSIKFANEAVGVNLDRNDEKQN